MFTADIKSNCEDHSFTWTYLIVVEFIIYDTTLRTCLERIVYDTTLRTGLERFQAQIASTPSDVLVRKGIYSVLKVRLDSNIFRFLYDSPYPKQIFVTIVTQDSLFLGRSSHANLAELAVIWTHDRDERHGSSLDFTSQTALLSCFQRYFALQSSLWRKLENRPMPLTSRSWVLITAFNPGLLFL